MKAIRFYVAMDDVIRPRTRWFQFTIARILRATFWIAICFALIAAWGTVEFESLPPVAAIFALTWLIFSLALGTLFGRAAFGLIIGAVLLGVYAAIGACLFMVGWIGV
jgi:hypothetical protein